jgi:hypothetical protein
MTLAEEARVTALTPHGLRPWAIVALEALPALAPQRDVPQPMQAIGDAHVEAVFGPCHSPGSGGLRLDPPGSVAQHAFQRRRGRGRGT